MASARQFRSTHNAFLTIRCQLAQSASLWISRLALACAASFLIVACQKGIGDGCDTALNCSASASRLCDMTQPGGYCTLTGCQAGSCPSESVCVTFWQNTDRREADRNRLSANYCMLKCDDSSDCRDDEGYRCFLGRDFGYEGEATVEEDPNQGFCAEKLTASAAQ